VLGRRAGLAIDNARLYAEVRETAGRIARLQSVTAGLARAITVEDVAETVVREGIAAFGARDGIFTVLSTNGETLDMVHAVGLDDGTRAAYRSLPVAADLPIPNAVRARTIITVESRTDLEAGYALGHPLGEQLRADSWLVVPLLAEERALGCIAFGFQGKHTSDADERALATAFAHQCVIALERARLYEAEQRARATARAAQTRAEFLAEASHLLASSLDYEQTLQMLVRAAVPRLGDWCAVDMLVDPEVEQWPPVVKRLAVAHRDPAGIARLRDLEQRFPADWNAPIGLPRVLRNGVTEFHPVVTDDLLAAVARSPEELALLREIGFHAFLCVPLIVRGRTVGAITLAMIESGRTYADADRTLAENLAQRAALAVEHAMLFREAQEANRVKAEFLAVMSHELRTPLNAIGGHVQLLDMGLHGPVTDAQREALGRVSRSQERLLGLINDILNYARLESGRVEFNFTSVSVGDVVGEVASLLEPQIAERRLTLDVRLPETNGGPPIPIVADREKLTQVVLNLFSNAVKFTPPGGSITVELATDPADPGLARLCVSDTGIGIPADKLHVVFEPFVQVGRGLTSTREGTGLGLAISRDLARGMGGDLTAESTVGVGSTFTLTLQRA
jgi:signal transduction histidine kinase